MKLFLTLILFFLSVSIYSQTNNNIHRIIFRHNNSVVINSGVEIYFFKDFYDKFYIDVITYKSKNKYSVSNEKASDLINAVSKISPIAVVQEVRNCLDGGRTEIEFSTSIIAGNTVNYSIYCLNIEDEKTAWSDYLNAVNLILDLAKLKFSDLE
ncbi:hypothetical protein SAMN05660845_2451 [Flavobacterium swingsii]|uniref:Uncharacterized protein n=1 Tax=Flavobacterium swingsii TaxID=498292 RepID=A0A1I0ZU99_9FLAO|nr:hypothetical protein SAMN05660845_2451 [Flavobacterium swingsii]